MNIKTTRGLAMLGIAALTGLIVLSQAEAVLQPKDNQVAAKTDCQRDAKPVSTVIIRTTAVPAGKNRGTDASRPAVPSRAVGNVQLVYSKKCRTAWAEVYTYAPYGKTKGLVHRLGKNELEFRCESRTPMWCKTNMVNDANAVSYAQGSVMVDGRWVDGPRTAYY